MRHFVLRPRGSPVKHAIGAIQGQDFLRPLLEQLQDDTVDPSASGSELVIVDFSGIESATASFIKATILHLIRFSQLAADKPTGDAPSKGTSILDIYPSVHALSTDVREELVEVLASQRLVCLEALAWNSQEITEARLFGPLDGPLWTTLQALLESGGATASELHERYPDERINATAWNNRLADLYRLRLAARVRRGRHWVYTSIARVVNRG